MLVSGRSIYWKDLLQIETTSQARKLGLKPGLRVHLSGMNENLIRELALPLGVVDVKVAAIDTDWSGLKLVWRVSNR